MKNRAGFLISLIVVELVLQIFNPTGAQASCGSCRNHAIGYRTDQQYNGVHAYIELADPAIRDGVNGFSAEVIWIGDIPSAHNVIEIGWRKTGVPFQGANMYWGYVDSNGSWSGEHWLGSAGQGRDYKIEYNSGDGKWHVYVGSSDQGSVSLGISSGYIEAGAEVSDQDPNNHNAAGVAGHLNLSYRAPGNSSYFQWGGWAKAESPGYHINPINSSNAFQTSGYN